MPSEKNLNNKAGSLKDPEISKLFYGEDPEKLYEDLREIGHGSFGAVYYARNVKTNDSVAIKKMSYSGKQDHDKWQDIIREVQFLTQVKHPNIVEYKGCYLKEHTAWLAMEYCIGSASDLVEVHKHPLQEDEISGIIHDAMQGLHYLHQHNKIHRDVKAGNILLTDRGQVKLADFGSASIVSPANSFVGTPYWMAPEVILAMDEGQYDGKADIWSMGITSLELAERKPPLFNMNAMSALYHIAQNDPPVLNDPETPDGSRHSVTCWSQDFRKFVSLLLQKSPKDRPESVEVLKHPFLTKQRSPTIVLELIMRTKDVVRDLDNLQYRKMKKILIAENRQNLQRQAAAGAAACQLGNEIIEEDGESLDGKTSSFGSLQSNPSLISATSSSKSDSINSLNDSRISDSSSVNSQEGASSSLSEYDANTTSTVAMTSTTGLPQQRSSSASIHKPVTDNSNLTRSSSERMAAENQPPIPASLHQHTSGETPVKGVRGRVHRDRFATIRSAQVINRQLNEHNEDNRHREQLQGYKKMRQQNQKQLIQYENKLKIEMDEHSAKLTKEYEALRQQFHQELERMLKRHQQERDKETKTAQNDVRKCQKHIDQQQDVEMKGFLTQQKKDFKQKKEQLKESSNARRMTKEERMIWLSRRMSDLTNMQEQSECELRGRQQQNRDLEMRKHRRRALLESHNLEHNFLREELNLKQVHKKKEHETLVAHHDSTQALEYRQLHDIQHLRMERLRSQHQTEMTNQEEYSQSREHELRRKHIQAMRQQPKNLKSKEAQIKKQFQETIKIQEKQYKAWRNHILETCSKKNQKELLRRKKDERMREVASLAQQYENSITDLTQKQTIKLSDSQEKERQRLKQTLQKEIELLTAYQSKVKIFSETQHERELKELEQKVSMRRAVLEQKMETDTQELEAERSSRIRNLLDVQGREIERFDEDSLKLGFTTVVVTNYGDQVYVDTQAHAQHFQQQRQRQHSDEGYSTGRSSNIHESASTSALQSGLPTDQSRSNIPRSSSGSSVRVANDNQYLHQDSNPIPYAHRTRPYTDHHRQHPTTNLPSHQRQGPPNQSRINRQHTDRQQSTGNNSNRNNSSSPANLTQFTSHYQPHEGHHVVQGPGGSPVMSHRQNVPFDEQSSMLQRVSTSNWNSAVSQRPEMGSNNLMHHGGSMSSLYQPPSSTPHHIIHQRSGKSGRSLDAADPSSNYIPSCSSRDDRVSPGRRSQHLEKSSLDGFEKKGRNSPRMGTSAFQNPQRYRQQPPQQGPPPSSSSSRTPGTSFSSSYH